MINLRSHVALCCFVLLCHSCVQAPEVTRSETVRPSMLRHDDADVPASVRALETVIDAEGALIADEITIHCSCNYEWDVSLSGEDVLPQRSDGDEKISEARGKARAQFRNLQLRAVRRIVFRKSGFDVQPFIRITAVGRAAYATDASVFRGAQIRIDNAQLTVDGLPVPAPTAPGSPLVLEQNPRRG